MEAKVRALLIAGVVVCWLVVGTASAATTPRLYQRCSNFNAKFAHGVGRVGARDKTKSGDPVTNFKRSNRIYALAMHYNSGLDRDKDKVACEKH
jgi:hypothetical protein